MGERKQLQEYELKILHLRGSGGFASAAKVAGMNGSAAALHFDPRGTVKIKVPRCASKRYE